MTDCIIFDLETTGFGASCEIIEISALKVVDNSIVDTFDTLVCPSSPISPNVTAINHITNDMVKNAPFPEDIIPDFLNFIGDNELIGHNITTFDLPVLRRYSYAICQHELLNPHSDVLYISKHKLELPDYKLKTIAEYFNIDYSGAHRALKDCYITYQCLVQLLTLPDIKSSHHAAGPSHGSKHTFVRSDNTKDLQALNCIIKQIITDNTLSDRELRFLNDWLNNHSYLSGNYPFDEVLSLVREIFMDDVIADDKRIYILQSFHKFLDPISHSSPLDIEKNLELSGKICCLSGDFESGSKSELTAQIEALGGIVKKSVTKSTDFLIVGNLGNENWACGNYGTKVKTAMEYNDKGCNITIIKESDFLNITSL